MCSEVGGAVVLHVKGLVALPGLLNVLEHCSFSARLYPQNIQDNAHRSLLSPCSQQQAQQPARNLRTRRLPQATDTQCSLLVMTANTEIAAIEILCVFNCPLRPCFRVKEKKNVQGCEAL